MKHLVNTSSHMIDFEHHDFDGWVPEARSTLYPMCTNDVIKILLDMQKWDDFVQIAESLVVVYLNKTNREYTEKPTDVTNEVFKGTSEEFKKQCECKISKQSAGDLFVTVKVDYINPTNNKPETYSLHWTFTKATAYPKKLQNKLTTLSYFNKLNIDNKNYGSLKNILPIIKMLKSKQQPECKCNPDPMTLCKELCKQKCAK